MSKLLTLTLATALGFAVSAPLYAADTTPSKQTTRAAAMSDAEYRAAMDKCYTLTDTARSRCIVNTRDNVSMPQGSPGEANTVKDGTGLSDAEYTAAVKECESANAADKDQCINTAKEHFGRM